MDQVLYYLIVREHGITNKCNNNTGEAERETSEHKLQGAESIALSVELSKEICFQLCSV